MDVEVEKHPKLSFGGSSFFPECVLNRGEGLREGAICSAKAINHVTYDLGGFLGFTCITFTSFLTNTLATKRVLILLRGAPSAAGVLCIGVHVYMYLCIYVYLIRLSRAQCNLTWLVVVMMLKFVRMKTPRS